MLRQYLPRGCAVAVSCALALSACGQDETLVERSTTEEETAGPPGSATATSPTTATDPITVIEVAYAGGEVVGGVRTVAVRLGDTVRIRLTSDVAEELHVHTYDAVAAVAPGQPSDLEFAATIPGRHEVELEKKHRTLMVLEVR